MQGNRFLRHMERVHFIKSEWGRLKEMAQDHGEVELVELYKQKEDETNELLNKIRDEHGR